MKKIWLILLMLLFTGCARQVKLETTKITRVEYDGLKIVADDYDSINKYLTEINFIETKYESTFVHDFIITTNDNLYSFRISEDYHMQYTLNEETYYSKDTADIKKLLDYLKSLDLTYRDDTFFEISSAEKYDTKDNDLYIKLDSTENYFTFISNQGIANFKINRIDYVDEQFEDIDLLYKDDSIIANKKVVIKTTFPDAVPNIKISFETKYGFVFSVIPSYNRKDGGFDYLITKVQK
jgi:hypothetical protein